MDEKRAKEIVSNIGFGLLFLLIAIPLTFFPLFEEIPDDWTVMNTVLSIAFLIIIWNLVFHCFLECFNRPWTKRVSRWILSFSLTLFGCFLLTVFITDRSESTLKVPMADTFGAFFLFTSAFGLLLYLGERRHSKSVPKQFADIFSSPIIIFVWPFLVFIKSPLFAFILSLPFIAIIYLGEWLGGKFGHPRIGAISASGVLLCAIAVIIFIKIRTMDAGEEVEEGE